MIVVFRDHPTLPHSALSSFCGEVKHFQSSQLSRGRGGGVLSYLHLRSITKQTFSMEVRISMPRQKAAGIFLSTTPTPLTGD
ncbi:hypothetical protein PoB_005015400 [Plakobranchus ocellatus]|uniref:Uncharacterized protein n=1 Tax=Plakobranchus ocellatus TaxID=259542 RepID=A0AAV4BXV5_9GAST|nr:hypothetical protein PoB_005015400 [Plakobranchus ocellatus]